MLRSVRMLFGMGRKWTLKNLPGTRAVKFSLIVPVYNVAKYLPTCLDSICAQTWTDFEAILVNDGSTDNSGEICAAYARRDPRLKVVSRPNGGLSAARNTGLRHASGEFLVFVDSDDWVERDMLDNYASEIVKWPEFQNLIIIAGYNKIYEKASKIGNITRVCDCYWPNYEIMDVKKATLELLEDYSFCNYMWNKCYSSSIFRDMWFPEGIIYEDIPVQVLLFQRAEQIVKRPCIVYNYRINRIGQICADKSIRNEASYVNSLLLRHEQLEDPEYQRISSRKIFAGFLNFLDKTYTAKCSEKLKREVRCDIMEKISEQRSSLEQHFSALKKMLLRYALQNAANNVQGIVIFNRVNYYRWRFKNLMRRWLH